MRNKGIGGVHDVKEEAVQGVVRKVDNKKIVYTFTGGNTTLGLTIPSATKRAGRNVTVSNWPEGIGDFLV